MAPQVFSREWTGKDGASQTSRVYYVRFQVDGKDYIRSTGKTKKGEAVQEMRRMISEVRTAGLVVELVNRFIRRIDESSADEQPRHRQKAI